MIGKRRQDEHSEMVRARPRVLLIDYDAELAYVVEELIKDLEIEVLPHNCLPEACTCLERAAMSAPDLIVVNVAHPAGGHADLRGWRCFSSLHGEADRQHLRLLAYTVFDRYTLREMGIDPVPLGVQVLDGLSNPAHLADEIARVIRHSEAT